jgi:ABC-type uncharacterized transport system substrate-binding protein
MGSADVVGKRLELLREVVPNLRRLAIMANAGYSATVLEMEEAQKLARMLALEGVPMKIRRTEDIAPAFEALSGGAQALYVCTELLAVRSLSLYPVVGAVVRYVKLLAQRGDADGNIALLGVVRLPSSLRLRIRP